MNTKKLKINDQVKFFDSLGLQNEGFIDFIYRPFGRPKANKVFIKAVFGCMWVNETDIKEIITTNN